MQFAVYPMPGGGRGYVVDVQSDLFSDLRTRVVIPLASLADAPFAPVSSLNPTFRLDGSPHMLVTQHMAAVLSSELGEPVASFADHREEIIRAMDVLISGV